VRRCGGLFLRAIRRLQAEALADLLGDALGNIENAVVRQPRQVLAVHGFRVVKPREEQLQQIVANLRDGAL
jgi:hypothetical protein